MDYHQPLEQRIAFRNWLRAQLRALDFYQRRGNRYLASEFVRYAEELEAHIEETSLCRYLRENNPVLPTPESCRELAKALAELELTPWDVMKAAGLVYDSDLVAPKKRPVHEPDTAA